MARERARKEGAKGSELSVRYLLLFEGTGACGWMPPLPGDRLHGCEGHYRDYLGWSDESWITRRTPSRTAGGSCSVSLMIYPTWRGPRSPLSPCRSSRSLIGAGQGVLPHSGMNGIRPPVGARRCHGRGWGLANGDR